MIKTDFALSPRWVSLCNKLHKMWTLRLMTQSRLVCFAHWRAVALSFKFLGFPRQMQCGEIKTSYINRTPSFKFDLKIVSRMSPGAYQKWNLIGQPKVLMQIYTNLNYFPHVILCRCTTRDKASGELAFILLTELKPLRFRKQGIEHVEEMPNMRKDRLYG